MKIKEKMHLLLERAVCIQNQIDALTQDLEAVTDEAADIGRRFLERKGLDRLTFDKGGMLVESVDASFYPADMGREWAEDDEGYQPTGEAYYMPANLRVYVNGRRTGSRGRTLKEETCYVIARALQHD